LRRSILYAFIAPCWLCIAGALCAQEVHQPDLIQAEPPESQPAEPDQAMPDALEGESSLKLDPGLTWTVIAEPYIWAPFKIDGDATVDGLTVDFNIKLDELLDKATVVPLSGRIEAWNSDGWGLILDSLYFGIEGDKFAVDLPSPLPSVVQRFRMSLIGGLRYQFYDLDINVSGPLGESASADWVEPMLGARIGMKVSEKLDVAMRGDLSGFGVGAASDLTWNVLLAVHYDFNPNARVILGYRALGVDYSHSSGSGEFALDMVMHGPWIGLAFRF
jgi:hypothetical protein